MKKLFLLAACGALFGVNAFAQQTFRLVSSEQKTVKPGDLTKAEARQTVGKKEHSNLTFTGREIHLVVLTGPEDDMLSYRVQGVRNPTLVIPAGATLNILFVNRDEDMKHDIRFGKVVGDFPIAPDVTNTAGSTRLDPKSDDDTMQAEEVVLTAVSTGTFNYFCSVRGHAKGGMRGNIVVGVKPDDKVKVPAKPGDGGMENMPGMNHKHGGMQMPSVTNIGDPMGRESSGTAWAPDSSPMYAHMKMFKDGGMLMLMGT
ncbi:MAG: hypothetical protein ACRD43_02175, partial [Pyrinomonadaceae bacterium]